MSNENQMKREEKLLKRALPKDKKRLQARVDAYKPKKKGTK